MGAAGIALAQAVVLAQAAVPVLVVLALLEPPVVAAVAAAVAADVAADVAVDVVDVDDTRLPSSP
jgi:hypothetical protein